MANINKMIGNLVKHAKTKICSCKLCKNMIMVDHSPENICEECMKKMKKEYKEQDYTFEEYKDAMITAAELTLDTSKEEFVYIKNRVRKPIKE